MHMSVGSPGDLGFSAPDEAIAVLVKDLEGLTNFLFTVSVLHFPGHHCEKFG